MTKNALSICVISLFFGHFSHALVDKCEDRGFLDKYDFVRFLGAGASGNAVSVKKEGSAEPSVMKITLCEGLLDQAAWKQENANYANLEEVSTLVPLFLQKKGEPFRCEGMTKSNKSYFWPTESRDGFSFPKEGSKMPERLEQCFYPETPCCYTFLEQGAQPFPYGVEKPGKMPVRVDDNAKAKTLLFEILFAHYAGFAKAGFQNWDLKEANLFMGQWPSDKAEKICFSWAEGKGRCINKSIAGNKLVKVFDLDISTSGGIPGIARVKKDGNAKTDAQSFRAIWENIKKEGTVDDGAFVATIDALKSLTPKSSLKEISDDAYDRYLNGLKEILESEYLKDALTPLPANCGKPDSNCLLYSISAE